VNKAAEGAGVGDEGSGDGESNGEVQGEVDEGAEDAIVISDGETAAALQPATKPNATNPTATPLRRPSRDLLP
jgi:hypothetical protein